MAVITVTGSINMDLVIRTARRPQNGEAVIGGAFGMTGGGKGSNQALALARLNAKAYMVGCVGDDDFGRMLSGVLKDSGVDCTCLDVKPGVMTGVAVVAVTDGGEYSIILSQGANALVDKPALERARDIFKLSDAAVFQLETPIETVTAGLKMAKEAGCKTFLLADPPFPLLDEAWPWIDCLILSQKALIIYTSKDTDDLSNIYSPIGAKSSETPAEPELSDQEIREKVAVLRSRGVRDIVVLEGADGGMAFYDRRSFSFKPTFDVHVVDTTGARDAFCAALCTGLSEGMTMEDAVQFASAAGALSCTKIGAYTSLPWRQEVEALLAKARDAE